MYLDLLLLWFGAYVSGVGSRNRNIAVFVESVLPIVLFPGLQFVTVITEEWRKFFIIVNLKFFMVFGRYGWILYWQILPMSRG